MRIGGWKTRSVFERYAIVNRTDIADAMLRLQHTQKALETATNEDSVSAERGKAEPPRSMRHPTFQQRLSR